LGLRLRAVKIPAGRSNTLQIALAPATGLH